MVDKILDAKTTSKIFEAIALQVFADPTPHTLFCYCGGKNWRVDENPLPLSVRPNTPHFLGVFVGSLKDAWDFSMERSLQIK